MRNRLAAAPYVAWMAVFVLAPLVLVTIFAVTGRDGALTISNFTSMHQYAAVFGRSFLMAFIATVICLLAGYPLAFFLAREGAHLRGLFTMLIMLPMWMNFLLRTYAWMSILDDNGLINQLLSRLGVFHLINACTAFFNAVLGTSLPAIEFIHMINTQGAIVLGMVYNFLPFMVLPVFSVICKIDPKVVEAAQDLGADSTTVFRRVILPLSLPGVLSGITMVFIPSVSTFALSRLLGGGKTMLLGDLIELQFVGAAYNPHLGSAIALVMMLIVIVCIVLMNRFGEGEEGVSVL